MCVVKEPWVMTKLKDNSPLTWPKCCAAVWLLQKDGGGKMRDLKQVTELTNLFVRDTFYYLK